MSGSRQTLGFAGAVVLLVTAAPAVCPAAGRFVEDIRVSREGEDAQVVIQLACRMRVRSDDFEPSGAALEVRVSPLDDCRQLGLGAGIASEVYRPVGGAIAALDEVEFEALGLGQDLFVLRFARRIDYEVSQRGDLRSIEIAVRAGEAVGDARRAPEAEPPSAPAATTSTDAAAPGSAATAGRAPMSIRVREPEAAPDYVINLQSTTDPVDTNAIAGIETASAEKLYISEAEVDGRTWYRLRIGFFATEDEARAALAPLAERFPRAWVGRAEAAEVSTASDLAFARGATVAFEAAPGPDAAAAAEAAGAGAQGAVVGAGALTPERVAALMAEAREAMLNEQYDAAIRLYTRLLEEPGEHRPEAREYLGLARERNGQIAHALAEYRTFLGDYPDDPGRRRVQQRLNGIVAVSQAARAPLRKGVDADADRWDASLGLSQYYRRDVSRFAEDQPDFVTLSALFTDLDLAVRRTGRGVDLLGRITVSNMYDLMTEQERGPGDQNRIAYAYLDVAGTQGGWGLRAGRQTLHHWGVLGRFDGLHVSYDWAPDRSVHYMTGYPVESTRDSLETYRRFDGVAVDFAGLVGDWDLSVFANRQTIEGIDDRNAVGLEIGYADARRSLTALVDYETSYAELNSAYVLGTWRFESRLALSALVDVRKSPMLTTRNALIGQPVQTIDELLLVWTEDEIRQLALDRTAESRTLTLGIAVPLAERFQLNGDVSVSEIDGTNASGGVLAIPGTGRQTYVSTSIVGSGLFGRGDVSIWTLRHGEADTFTTSLLSWDVRVPVGRRVRLNPRLALAVWEDPINGRKRETVSPSFRLLFNTRNRYRLELEYGANLFTRTDLTGASDSSDKFVYLGYRADF